MKTFFAILCFACVAGCSTAPAQPRTRLGSIPFPGIFTLYTTADPQRLGQHRYEAWWDKLDGPNETSRGILYTCRAGFLDLSHIRDSIDWAKYIHDRTLECALRFGTGPASSQTFAFSSSDARYEVELREPEWWHTLDPSERDQLAREAAIRIGQRLTVIMATWHEIGTWYGQETIPGISEQNSAFTWDDGTSHVVAAIVAGRALRTGDPWDIAVTRELAAELEELGAVDSSCESQAIDLVKDRWWKNGIAVRRDLDTGLDHNPKIPWLVPGLPCCTHADPGCATLVVSDLHDVQGRDLTPMLDLRIIPSRSILRKAAGTSSSTPSAIHGEPALLQAIERVRAEMLERWGPDADKP